MHAGEPRLFLALWPPVAVRRAIEDHARLWRWPAAARATPPERLHLTLHFIGAVPAARLEEVKRGLAVRSRPASLQLGTPELWAGGIAVLRGRDAPAALLDLHEQLGRALLALGLPVEQRPFRPHFTLARRAGGAVAPTGAPAIEWKSPGAYLLVQSLPAGQGYQPLANYG
jgi:RNA 2',3'-cyclic 3'-phosphodiesterase